MLKRLLSGWLSAALVLAGCGLTWAALVPAQSQARACGRDAVNESSACRLVIANHSRVLSKVTATTADLQVTVAWTGRPATYGFQYGDTTPYDATVTTAGPRSSDGRTVLMRAQISGLTPDTLYRFVAYAHSSRGWSYTTVGSFRTTPERHPSVPSPAPTSGAGRTVAPTASAATATTTTTTPSGSTPAPAAPAGPTMLWGAQIGSQFTGNDAPWDMNAVSDFAAMVGKAPSVIPFNLPFEDCSNPSACYWYDFPTTQMNNVNAYGAITMLNWSSMSAPLATDEPAFTLADVAAGDFDSYIEQFAQAAAQWGHPFLLRFDWEMNGNWFPWEAGANGNTPAEFVAAWRHVHDIFTAAGATNAAWVWCPNVDFDNRFTPLAQLYPGDGYVDWTCLDGYNMGNLNGAGGWMTFNQIFASTYREVVAIAPDKPMIIGETASSETGGNKAQWITDMFADLPWYPKIRGLVWFDKYDGSDDWPLETSPSATDAFSAAIASPTFATNTYAGDTQPTVAPPGGS